MGSTFSFICTTVLTSIFQDDGTAVLAFICNVRTRYIEMKLLAKQWCQTNTMVVRFLRILFKNLCSVKSCMHAHTSDHACCKHVLLTTQLKWSKHYWQANLQVWRSEAICSYLGGICMGRSIGQPNCSHCVEPEQTSHEC